MNKNKKILTFEYDFEYNAYLGVKQVIDTTYAPLPLNVCNKSYVQMVK